MADYNVLAATFEDDSKAYQALSELKGAGLEGRVEVRSAAIVSRDQNGALSVPEATDNVSGSSTLGGGLIGLLIGVLGGPIGMLFGWTTGAIIGGVADFKRDDDTSDVISQISKAIPAGTTAVVAELNEYTPEVVDALISGLGGTIHRRPAIEVLTQLEAAEEAYEAGQREAKKVAKEQRRAERRENFDERKAALKEKLGIE
ncbi:DUF1269 domain-containing protein [Actinomycetaceae bacterium L2_0104]